MAEWLVGWTYNLVVPSSIPPPCYLLDLFSIAPSLAHWLHFTQLIAGGFWNKAFATPPNGVLCSLQVKTNR